ncbi:flagellin [Paeniglutamicibacter psychrophenolicus]|uniref:Flagellin n=2 Tax=Paeniglutamicibacter psychrophenolicus TaxID=257454 RepID=A0ABS4WCW8_9MICC|nr:flagellin [Paeniglutamicibacter psychrophenolicus]MBP2374052.1 flagellin [Paeniglutamicibacter psychrophenolicus]
MGMQINTNLAALNAHRNLSNTQNDLSKSLEKLSSGLRINRAADDAAGLAISEGLRSQVNGLSVAARNAQDGISVIQTAEGGLTEAHSILQRLRDLSVQAGNDSNNADSRAAITKEADELVSELARIGQSTNFNGIKLLSGDVDAAAVGKQATLNFQIGADGDASSQIDVQLANADVTGVASRLSTGTGSTFSLDASATLATLTFTAEDGAATPNTLATAAVDISGLTLEGGAAPTTAQAASNMDKIVNALNGDTNFAKNFTATKNDAGELVVKSTTGAVVDTDTAPGAGLTGVVQGAVGSLDFSTAAGAQAAISAIDIEITGISSARAELGAKQNRFESAINSLNVSRENLQAAESRIRDVDMAAEMVNFTRSNILSQAGTAMLAQANQSNQGVLQLLG